MADKWSAMLGDLVAYRKSFGTTDVASRDSTHARLGRWVAAQRHKHRKGILSPARASKLTKAGMIWAPGDKVWKEMLGQLKTFAKREGHCNIPEHYPPNQRLASWAHNQRYRKRRGDLSAERAEKLEGIGFKWAIYRRRKRSGKKVIRGRVSERNLVEDVVIPQEVQFRRAEERLYRLRQGTYVQFNGEGQMPEPLLRLKKQNKELPPYIPLPRGKTVFLLETDGDEPHDVPVKWSGTGPIPAQVLDYVRENGCLPRHNY